MLNGVVTILTFTTYGLGTELLMYKFTDGTFKILSSVPTFEPLTVIIIASFLLQGMSKLYYIEHLET